MTNLKISVAMCSYNGAMYISEQLDSFFQQTRIPDELVIFDDGSTDDTILIIENYISKSIFPIRLFKNEINLGSTKNFEQSIYSCTGDIIVLSDQDDIWYPNKLKLIEQEFIDKPNAGMVFSDAALVDYNLESVGITLWKSVNFIQSDRDKFLSSSKIDTFRILLKKYVVTGATLAFRKYLVDLVLPIPEVWVHDAWIALLIAGLADIIPIPDLLVGYRQHPNQQLGAPKQSAYAQTSLALQENIIDYEVKYKKFDLALEHIKKHRKLFSNDMLNYLESKVIHLKIRHQIQKEYIFRRIYLILGELLFRRYHMYSSGWKSAVKDLIINI